MGRQLARDKEAQQMLVTSHRDAEQKQPLNSIDWVWDIQQHKLQIDKAELEHLLSTTLPNVSGNLLLSYLSYEDQCQLSSMIGAAVSDLQPRAYSCCMNVEDGRAYWVLLSFSATKSGAVTGQLTPMLCLCSDSITVSHLVSQLLDIPECGVIVTDDNGRILQCNSILLSQTGYSRTQLLNHSLEMLASQKHSEAFYQQIWRRFATSGYWSGVVLVPNATGVNNPQKVVIKRIQLTGQSLVLVLFYDLSKQLYRIEDIENDGLDIKTQLPSESQFTQLVVSTLENDLPCLSFVVVFTPQFSERDEIEQKSALAEALAESPLVKSAGYLGSNHFSVLLQSSDVDPAKQTENIHQTIRRLCNDIGRSAGLSLYRTLMSGKIGVSVYKLDTHNPKLLVPHAVQATLAQVDQSKGAISFYHGALNQQTMQITKLENRISDLIKGRNLETFYQPVVDVVHWEVVQFEALCRFRGERGQLLNTAEAIMVAEDLGLIADLDWYVGRKVLQDVGDIQRQFGRNVGVAINRSLNSKLQVGEVLESLRTMVEQSSINRSSVTVELSESDYFNCEYQESPLLRNLKRSGLHFSIDRFGSGHSCLTSLAKGNFDQIKIDRHLIQGIAPGCENYAATKAIIELAHALNTKVVAVGVETQAELETLCDLGIDLVQGYFISEPLALDQLQNALRFKQRLRKSDWGYHKVRRSGLLSITDTNAPCISIQNSVDEALQVLRNGNELEVLPVLEGKRCIGLVQASRLYQAKGAGQSSLIDTVNNDFQTISYQVSLDEFTALLKDGFLLPAVVVSETGNYLGLIDQHAALRYLLKRETS
ncbi:MAG: EAL domain-containing protein [Vibrionaceae bacterium]|nr:EAL domain-containing protein [Vibrionaceae bacterium]